jgi:4-diphosphocytidyl-2-C-methyl-D-erythritol kinase
MFVKRVDRKSLVIGAPAKVNLFLEVISKREDGFHNINSLFQAVSLFDRLRIERVSTPGIDLIVRNNNKLSAGRDNLIAQAYRLMQKEFSLPGGLDVELEKNIPVGAGLGGGSSDCAAVIMAVSILHDLALDRQEMAKLGGQLGSDVPFFFGSGQAHVSGRGDLIVDVDLPTDYWLVLVSPEVWIATADAYAALKTDLTMSRAPAKFVGCRGLGDFLEFLDGSGNDFESSHFESYPEHRQIQGRLLESGARIARMSGTGSTFFGVFEEYPEVEEQELFDGSGWRTDVVRPITLPTVDIVDAGGARGDY